jgi:insulysin
MSEPAFDQLRTKEQLGYIVFTGSTKVGPNLALRVIVQSTKDPHYLDGRIEAFLVQFRAELAAFSAEKLRENVTAVRELQLERPKNHYDEFSDLYVEIEHGTFLFQRKRLLATALGRLQQEREDKEEPLRRLLAFFDRHVLAGSATRRKLSSHFYGQGGVYKKVGADRHVMGDRSLFKQRLGLQPAQCHDPQPSK